MTVHTSKLIEAVKARLNEEEIEFTEEQFENVHSLTIKTITKGFFKRDILLISNKVEGFGWMVWDKENHVNFSESRHYEKESGYTVEEVSNFVINAYYA